MQCWEILKKIFSLPFVNPIPKALVTRPSSPHGSSSCTFSFKKSLTHHHADFKLNNSQDKASPPLKLHAELGNLKNIFSLPLVKSIPKALVTRPSSPHGSSSFTFSFKKSLTHHHADFKLNNSQDKASPPLKLHAELGNLKNIFSLPLVKSYPQGSSHSAIKPPWKF
ncbi:hypothetical protein CEXT_192061 [Caerostris extrusa]|uniref:Uncharacterized protein n=1 Tax=Caerostris extrusa TaxID=172846 RepID=A0AAV4RGC5_CAEEX|nr:hypothetical protein CEXT_192061 [Caerostris extrusa]